MKERISRSLLWVLASLLALACVTQVAAEEHPFVGSKKCKMCHLKEWKSWAETKMANAFETLKPGERADAKRAAGLDPEKDYTTDPECVRCHVTGHGKDGGFTSTEETPELAGVGCEACHGPGGTYLKAGYMTVKNKEYAKPELVAVGMVDRVTSEQCVDCHNTDSPFVGHDYVFDFEARKNDGTHDLFPLKHEH